MQPTYVVATLPGEKEPEFLLILPFTPRGKDNLIGWMAARCDGDQLGELVYFQLSKQQLMYGPMQIESRIDQDQNISKDLTLWNQQGSRVLRGNIIALPVTGGFLYVESIYIQATEARMPQLKKVVLAMGDRLIYRDTFDEALAELTGAPAPAKPTTTTVASTPTPAQAAQRKCSRARRSAFVGFESRLSNWSGSWRRWKRTQLRNRPAYEICWRQIGVAEETLVSVCFSLLCELERARAAFDPFAGSCRTLEVGLDVVAVLGASRRIPSGYVFLGTRPTFCVERGIAIGRDRAIDFERAWFTLGTMQPVKDAVFYCAGELIGVAQSVPRRRAGDSGQPVAVERLRIGGQQDVWQEHQHNR